MMFLRINCPNSIPSPADYVKWFLKIHNLTLIDAQINFNDTYPAFQLRKGMNFFLNFLMTIFSPAFFLKFISVGGSLVFLPGLFSVAYSSSFNLVIHIRRFTTIWGPFTTWWGPFTPVRPSGRGRDRGWSAPAPNFPTVLIRRWYTAVEYWSFPSNIFFPQQVLCVLK